MAKTTCTDGNKRTGVIGTIINAVLINKLLRPYFSSKNEDGHFDVGWEDVRAYGAVGDGSHDDIAAIELAIAAAKLNNRHLFFPAGTYLFSRNPNIDVPTVIKGILKWSGFRPTFSSSLDIWNEQAFDYPVTTQIFAGNSGTYTSGGIEFFYGTNSVSQSYDTNKSTTLTALATQISGMTGIVSAVYNSGNDTLTVTMDADSVCSMALNIAAISGSYTVSISCQSSPNFLNDNFDTLNAKWFGCRSNLPDSGYATYVSMQKALWCARDTARHNAVFLMPGAYYIAQGIVVPDLVLLRSGDYGPCTILPSSDFSDAENSFLVKLSETCPSYTGGMRARIKGVYLSCKNGSVIVGTGVYTENCQEYGGVFDSAVVDYLKCGIKFQGDNSHPYIHSCKVVNTQIYRTSTTTNDDAPCIDIDEITEAGKVSIIDVTAIGKNGSLDESHDASAAIKLYKSRGYFENVHVERAHDGINVNCSGALISKLNGHSSIVNLLKIENHASNVGGPTIALSLFKHFGTYIVSDDFRSFSSAKEMIPLYVSGRDGTTPHDDRETLSVLDGLQFFLNEIRSSSTISIGKDTGDGLHTRLRLRGLQLPHSGSNFGSYGDVIFNASTALTSDARRILATNAYLGRLFALISSPDSATDPTLGEDGVISVGSLLFSIDPLTGFVSIGTTSSCSPLTMGGTFQSVAGAAAAETVFRFGKTATEGLELKCIDEILNTNGPVASLSLTNDVPANKLLYAVQANLVTAITGSGGAVKVGIGISSDPDKYGLSADLSKNAKVDRMPNAALSGTTSIGIYACDTSGNAAGTIDGQVRIRLYYWGNNSLDDAV
jgi:hypothetical protein